MCRGRQEAQSDGYTLYTIFTIYYYALRVHPVYFQHHRFVGGDQRLPKAIMA